MLEKMVEGVDVIFDYEFDTPAGLVELQGVSTYLSTTDLIKLPGEAALECAGYCGSYCGKNPRPTFSGNYRATCTPRTTCPLPLQCGSLAAPKTWVSTASISMQKPIGT